MFNHTDVLGPIKNINWVKCIKGTVLTVLLLFILFAQGINTSSSVTNITKNQNGHYVVTITGRALTGTEEVARLESAGFRVDDYARQILTNGDYDNNHRLEAGKQYQVVLVPGKEITGFRTTKKLKDYAAKFGYVVPKAGFVSLIRETISDEKMKEMGIWYIAALHEPIKDVDGTPSVLGSDRNGDGRLINAHWDIPAYEWFGDDAAFAFLVP
jgi:hypothetical protein